MLYPLARALATTPSPGNLAAAIAKFGAVELEFYQPKGADTQKPHARDELYVIVRGSGIFEHAGETFNFTAGDALFVAAHVEHRFVEFTNDFATWVIFF